MKIRSEDGLAWQWLCRSQRSVCYFCCCIIWECNTHPAMHGGGSGGSWNPLWLFCGMKLMFLPIQLCWLEESHGRNTKRLKGCCSLHSLWRQTKRGSQFSWGCFIRFANYEKIAMVTHRGRRKCGKFRQRKMFALRRFFLLAKYGGGNLNDLPWLAAVLQIFLFDCENA